MVECYYLHVYQFQVESGPGELHFTFFHHLVGRCLDPLTFPLAQVKRIWDELWVFYGESLFSLSLPPEMEDQVHHALDQRSVSCCPDSFELYFALQLVKASLGQTVGK